MSGPVYDLLRKHGGRVETLRAAAGKDPALRAKVEQEIAALTDGIVDRCFSSKRYREELRAALP